MRQCRRRRVSFLGAGRPTREPSTRKSACNRASHRSFHRQAPMPFAEKFVAFGRGSSALSRFRANGAAKRLASNLRHRFAGLTSAGSYPPPPRLPIPEEGDEAVRMINASKANLVWLGLGCRKQEQWLAARVGLSTAGQNGTAVARGASPSQPLDTITQPRVCGSMYAAARSGFRMRHRDRGQFSLARPGLSVAGACSSGGAESRVW